MVFGCTLGHAGSCGQAQVCSAGHSFRWPITADMWVVKHVSACHWIKSVCVHKTPHIGFSYGKLLHRHCPFQQGGSCSSAFLEAAPRTHRGCWEHLRQSLQSSSKSERHSLPTNNHTKTHPISWCCCCCQHFQACSFPGEIHGMHTHQTMLHLTWVAWFQASIEAVGAPIFSLRAHLRLVQIKVNQWQSLLLQLCKGDHTCQWLPQQKSRMLEGSCCDAEKGQMRSCFCCARHHGRGQKEPVAVPKSG